MKKITSIEPQKKHKARYNIYVDNKFFIGVDEDVVIKYSLSTGKEVTDDFLQNVVKAEEYARAFNAALNKLSYRARSQSEIEKALKEKGYNDEVIKTTIDKLIKYKYLDDVTFANSLIKEKQIFSKAGKQKVKQELYRKGIDREIINQLLTENISDEEEYERALELAKERYTRLDPAEDRNSKYRKLSGLLARKGYSYGIISKVMRAIFDNKVD